MTLIVMIRNDKKIYKDKRRRGIIRKKIRGIQKVIKIFLMNKAGTTLSRAPRFWSNLISRRYIMAKVKFTAIVAQMSGKLAGSVFARCRYGNYIRTLTSPINSSTPYQERVRSLFTQVVSGWYNLTDDERAAWNSRAAMSSGGISFGESFNYTGRALFSQLNRNLQEIGEAMLTTPPVLDPVETFDTFSVDLVDTPGLEDIKANLSPAIDANTKVIIYGTPVLGKAVVYISPNWYRKVAILDHSFISGGSIKVDYLSIFKTMPAEGQRVAFKMKAVAVATGKDQTPLTCVSTGTV
jgi:hypothetical protein